MVCDDETVGPWMHCACHKLQLFIRGIIDKNAEVANVVKRVDGLISAFQTIGGAQLLREQQVERNERTPLVVISYTDTRWNSKYLSIKRLLKLRAVILAIQANVAEQHATPIMRTFYKDFSMKFLTPVDFDTLHDLMAVLTPTAILTEQMSSPGPVITTLYPKLYARAAAEPQLTVESIVNFRRVFNARLLDLFSLDEMSDEVLIATYLHPTNIAAGGFFREGRGAELRQRVLELILGASDPTSPFSFGIDFEVTQSVEDRRARLLMELTEYRRLSSIDRVTNYNKPQEFWARQNGNLPRLADFARIFLSIQASSAASERLFSVSGGILTRLRTRTTPRRLKQLVLISTWEPSKIKI